MKNNNDPLASLYIIATKKDPRYHETNWIGVKTNHGVISEVQFISNWTGSYTCKVGDKEISSMDLRPEGCECSYTEHFYGDCKHRFVRNLENEIPNSPLLGKMENGYVSVPAKEVYEPPSWDESSTFTRMQELKHPEVDWVI